jgi:hypothetical protein
MVNKTINDFGENCVVLMKILQKNSFWLERVSENKLQKTLPGFMNGQHYLYNKSPCPTKNDPPPQRQGINFLSVET